MSSLIKQEGTVRGIRFYKLVCSHIVLCSIFLGKNFVLEWLDQKRCKYFFAHTIASIFPILTATSTPNQGSEYQLQK